MKKPGLFQRLKEAFYSISSSSYGGYGGNGFFGRIMEPFAGAWQQGISYESRENVLAFSAVYSCISLITDDIAKLRIKLMEQDAKGIWREVSSPAFTPVLRKPNRYQTRIQFLSQWVMSKLIYGNAYIYLRRDNRGVVTSMYVLDSRRVTPMVTDEGSVYYRLSEDHLSDLGWEAVVPASEMIHDRMLCLFHPLVGISPIYACGASATQGIRIQANSEKLFRNMSRPGGQLTAPGTIDDVTATRLKAEFEKNFSGDNVYRIMVAGDGLKYEAMTIPATEAQLIEQLKWTVEDVARCFHVPMHKLGISQPINTSVVALNQDYYSQTLQTFIECIEICLDEALGLGTAPNATYGTELDLDGILRMDPTSLAEALAKSVGAGIMAPDEARARMNLGPVAGGSNPYLQQQNYSLEDLAKRGESGDPFGMNPAPAPAAPTPEPAPVKEIDYERIAAMVRPQTDEESAADLTKELIARFQSEVSGVMIKGTIVQPGMRVTFTDAQTEIIKDGIERA